jgi:hypothetical protein
MNFPSTPLSLETVLVSNQTGRTVSFDFAKIIGTEVATIEADFSVGFISIPRALAKQYAHQIRPHQKMLVRPVIFAPSCQTEKIAVTFDREAASTTP